MPVPNPRSPFPKRLAAAAAAFTMLFAPSLSLAAELLPDLHTLQPEDISIEVTETGRYLLRFTQKFTNDGPGPLRIRGVPTEDPELMLGFQEILDAEGNVVRTVATPSIIYHPHHLHWHAGDVATYEFREAGPSGPVVAQNGKISFCLVDQQQSDTYTGQYWPPIYLNCETEVQGLNPGWVDIYNFDLHDQWVDVTGVPDGVYHLVVTGDADRVYVDKDRENNVASVKVELLDGGRQVRVMAQDELLLSLNGEPVRLPAHTRILEGRAVAHVRLAEHLGATVRWDGTRAIITMATKRLEIQPGESLAFADGRPVEMGAVALLDEGRILVPVQFLSEQLGFTASYHEPESTVEIRH